MKNLKKKYSVKVPGNIKILYCDKKNIITFIGPLATKSLKLKIKIFMKIIVMILLIQKMEINKA